MIFHHLMQKLSHFASSRLHLAYSQASPSRQQCLFFSTGVGASVERSGTRKNTLFVPFFFPFLNSQENAFFTKKNTNCLLQDQILLYPYFDLWCLRLFKWDLKLSFHFSVNALFNSGLMPSSIMRRFLRGSTATAPSFDSAGPHYVDSTPT